MNRLACLVALAAAVFAGCTTPSVHPIYTGSTLAEDPGIVGTWKQPDDAATYTVTRVGSGYHLLVNDRDKDQPKTWEFALMLTQIGAHRYADVAAAEKERAAQGERWGPLFVGTHLFCRYRVEGDALEVRMLNLDWFRRAGASGDVSLASTALDTKTTLITAETTQLRAFLEKHGGDDAAFSHRTRLVRVKP